GGQLVPPSPARAEDDQSRANPQRGHTMSGSPRASEPSGPYGELEQLALRVREHIIRMSTDGGCFIGASLSCADLLVHLYSRVLRIAPATHRDPDRDFLLLSKGHDVPALYATLAELGFLPTGRLSRHLDPDD